MGRGDYRGPGERISEEIVVPVCTSPLPSCPPVPHGHYTYSQPVDESVGVFRSGDLCWAVDPTEHEPHVVEPLLSTHGWPYVLRADGSIDCYPGEVYLADRQLFVALPAGVGPKLADRSNAERQRILAMLNEGGAVPRFEHVDGLTRAVCEPEGYCRDGHRCGKLDVGIERDQTWESATEYESHRREQRALADQDALIWGHGYMYRGERLDPMAVVIVTPPVSPNDPDFCTTCMGVVDHLPAAGCPECGAHRSIAVGRAESSLARNDFKLFAEEWSQVVSIGIEGQRFVPDGTWVHLDGGQLDASVFRPDEAMTAEEIWEVANGRGETVKGHWEDLVDGEWVRRG